MNFVTLEYCLQVMSRTGCKYWYIYDCDKNVIGMQTDAGTDIQASCALLQESMATIAGEWVHVRASVNKLSETPDKKTNVFNFKIPCSMPSPVQKNTPVTGFGTMPGGFGTYERLMERITDLQMKNQEEGFNRRLDKLEESYKKKETPADRLVNALVLKMFKDEKQGISSEPVKEVEPISGHPKKTETGEDKKKQIERLQAALMKLRSVDEDYITTLEKLAGYAETKPDTYKQYKTVL